MSRRTKKTEPVVTRAERKPEAVREQPGTAVQTAPAPAAVMGLTAYLQNYPQDSGVEAIMRLKHAPEGHSKDEWDDIVLKILGKKTR